MKYDVKTLFIADHEFQMENDKIIHLRGFLEEGYEIYSVMNVNDTLTTTEGMNTYPVVIKMFILRKPKSDEIKNN